jgi:hypothetical protein
MGGEPTVHGFWLGRLRAEPANRHTSEIERLLFDASQNARRMLRPIGWVERGETHRERFLHAVMGFAALNPSYGDARATDVLPVTNLQREAPRPGTLHQPQE